jgi:hypothetical protein
LRDNSSPFNPNLNSREAYNIINKSAKKAARPAD